MLVAEAIGARRAAQIFEDARFDPTNVRTLGAVEDNRRTGPTAPGVCRSTTSTS